MGVETLSDMAAFSGPSDRSRHCCLSVSWLLTRVGFILKAPCSGKAGSSQEKTIILGASEGSKYRELVSWVIEELRSRVGMVRQIRD